MIFKLFCAVLALVSATWAANLHQVANFGPNPTKLQMFVHVPDKPAPNPAVIMALHGCGGSAQQMFYNTRLKDFADKRNYITIYPHNTFDGRCWDVSSTKSLKHDGGGDSTGLAQMVKYTIKTYNANATRVFVSGQQSGGMMTNVLAATYPDLFAAGAVFSGVVPGCGPLLRCALGRINHPADEWATLISEMFPGYSGKRPRMQLWHATTDLVVQYGNLAEQVKAWSAVLDVPFRANVTDNPHRGYTKMQFGDGTQMVAYSAAGVPVVGYGANTEVMLKWFKLAERPGENVELNINQNGGVKPI